ncbi:MAG: sigma-70 family RNA polymerase sigma factor, partial [Lachnospiraceae bacterium]|nr:sigma-70 family RNA polymerase sigma factor [Lachnospiraceae bacterium]
NYIKVSRSMKELAYKINQLKDNMLKERGEEPGIEQLAEALLVEKEEIVFAMESAREVESIYNTVSRTNGDELLLIDRIQSKEDSSNEIVQHVTVEQLLNRLPEKEKKIIELRYYEDKTQAQIGELLGISQVQVSRIEKRILKWMRQELEG